jgi:hypothetical protein
MNQRTVSAMQGTSIAVDLEAALNENQAAEFLGLSVRTLQTWRVRGGGPPYCKIGRSVRYQRADLAAFRQSHSVGSTSEARARRDVDLVAPDQTQKASVGVKADEVR